jgi:hypothetical protein
MDKLFKDATPGHRGMVRICCGKRRGDSWREDAFECREFEFLSYLPFQF